MFNATQKSEYTLTNTIPPMIRIKLYHAYQDDAYKNHDNQDGGFINKLMHRRSVYITEWLDPTNQYSESQSTNMAAIASEF